jgi:hypothetical protein
MALNGQFCEARYCAASGSNKEREKYALTAYWATSGLGGFIAFIVSSNSAAVGGADAGAHAAKVNAKQSPLIRSRPPHGLTLPH